CAERADTAVAAAITQARQGRAEAALALLSPSLASAEDRQALCRALIDQSDPSLARVSALRTGRDQQRVVTFLRRSLVADPGYRGRRRSTAPWPVGEQAQAGAGSVAHQAVADRQADANSPADRLKAAARQREAGQYQAAEDLLTAVLQEQPQHVGALQELGRLKSVQQQWSQAVEVYDRLLNTQTTALGAILTRARMRLNADQLQQSIAELEQAESLGFESTGLRHQLAVVYRDDRQWEAAEQQIDHVLRTDARYATKKLAFATFAADVLRKRERVQEARRLLQAAVDAATARGEAIPLTTSAILQELKRVVEQPNASPEVSRYFYDSIYAQSEKYQTDPAHSVYLPVWERVRDALKVRGVRRVLDIGCGPGQFAQYLLAQIPDLAYLGVDYSQTAIREAQRKCPSAQFFERDIMQEQALAEFQADAYVVLEVLEHIEQDCGLLARVPAGQWVVMSVPNFDSFGHVRFFENEDEVKGRYEKLFSGFRIETTRLGGRSKIFLATGDRSRFPLNQNA
ncbi:MAG: methyltransferase domain-containing protein, partial [Pseudomonadales bacterium]|nr:methyltransferase domain-containing protein [Pseudomonadales bacterium]